MYTQHLRSLRIVICSNGDPLTQSPHKLTPSITSSIHIDGIHLSTTKFNLLLQAASTIVNQCRRSIANEFPYFCCFSNIILHISVVFFISTKIRKKNIKRSTKLYVIIGIHRNIYQIEEMKKNTRETKVRHFVCQVIRFQTNKCSFDGEIKKQIKTIWLHTYLHIYE